jgi:hypothetical protein
LIASTGARFGVRPSELLNIDPASALALEVDISADLHLRLLEAQQADRANKELEDIKRGHR